MLHDLITERAREWARSPDCPFRSVLDHIHGAGRLRPPQVEAITVWAYLKTAGQGKPLGTLFAEGFFTPEVDLDTLSVPVPTRDALRADPALLALYHYASARAGSDERLPALAERVREDPDAVDARDVIDAMFYGEGYTDYLLSLPMGAGKTFLIAALIHLELYLAVQAPDHPAFARNFLVLIPSGLKSSIGPSLRTIEHFDPTWVLPEPAASDVHRMIRLDVLDEAKSGRKSNKARNPNAARVAACAPFEDALGHVFVVNAEKVILNRVPKDPDLFDDLLQSDDDRDREENELRNLLGKLPRLGIHTDEVHHAQADDIKLRQVVNRWAERGDVAAAYGYSGTPYLKKAETIEAQGVRLKFQQITNTVYHYPLTTAIEGFLKTPTVKVAENAEPLEIVRRGVEDFYDCYGDTVYADGTRAKLAVYCSNIARLEEEVRPFLTGTLGIPEADVLTYHKGNRAHPIPAENEAAFRMLDRPESTVRVVLLVQIGKEGWDCRSLTGVVLSQKGDSPRNMVLQTACRCLRQVTPADDATALVWLNEYNAKALNDQLKTEQHTSIAELNKLARGEAAEPVERHSRLDHLGLPEIPLLQLRVRHTETTATAADPGATLAALADDLEETPSPWARTSQVVETGLTDTDVRARQLVETAGATAATWAAWRAGLRRAGLGVPDWRHLQAHRDVLRRVFDAITTGAGGHRQFNDLYRRAEVEAAVRRAFHPARTLTTEAETVPESARLLGVGGVPALAPHDLLYPPASDVREILRRDAAGEPGDGLSPKQQETIASLDDLGQHKMAAALRQKGSALPVRMKDRTFQYLPYSFRGSRLELNTFTAVLEADLFGRADLDVFFNGERRGQASLSEFRIDCYQKPADRWLRLGFYTPDFLVTQRGADGAFRRVLIIETKGAGYASEPTFVAKRQFVEDWFRPTNNAAQGVPAFEFLQLTDDEDDATRLARFKDCVDTFFAPATAA